MSAPLALKTPPGVLGEIVARTQHDVALREAKTPLDALQAGLKSDCRGFARALQAPGIGLIAEFKPRSPSRGELRPGAIPEGIAAIYKPFASAISVLCDGPYFGGSHRALGRVRGVVDCPVLCKDFIVSRYQVVEARAHGADAVLLMASLLPKESLGTLLALTHALGMDALVEVHDQQELGEAVESGAKVIGVNSRDLHTLKIDTERARGLLAQVPTSKVRVAESGLNHRPQVEALEGLADAALIGSALMSAPDPAAKIRQLGWTPCL